jgi:hypothetical protein
MTFDQRAHRPEDIASFLHVILGLPIVREIPAVWVDSAAHRSITRRCHEDQTKMMTMIFPMFRLKSGTRLWISAEYTLKSTATSIILTIKARVLPVELSARARGDETFLDEK